MHGFRHNAPGGTVARSIAKRDGNATAATTAPGLHHLDPWQRPQSANAAEHWNEDEQVHCQALPKRPHPGSSTTSVARQWIAAFLPRPPVTK
jgi:hypothetical protein